MEDHPLLSWKDTLVKNSGILKLIFLLFHAIPCSKSWVTHTHSTQLCRYSSFLVLFKVTEPVLWTAWNPGLPRLMREKWVVSACRTRSPMRRSEAACLGWWYPAQKCPRSCSTHDRWSCATTAATSSEISWDLSGKCCYVTPGSEAWGGRQHSTAPSCFASSGEMEWTTSAFMNRAPTSTRIHQSLWSTTKWLKTVYFYVISYGVVV